MHTYVEIRASALKSNLIHFRRATSTGVMAVLKSNAYGHDLELCTRAVRGQADWIGVNSIEEAIRVRKVDDSTPVLVMGANDTADYKEIASYASKPVLVLSTIDAIRELEDHLPGHPFHLKVDTGMSRLGHHGVSLQKIFSYLSAHPELNWCGLMTHFANVEDVTDQTYAQEQLNRFDEASAFAVSAAGNRKLAFHTAASGAALLLPESRRDLVRVGISLYGMWPSRETRISASALTAQGTLDSSFKLEPALQWKTRIVHINAITAGTAVGYGCTYRPVQDSNIAVLPVGYFEGYDRRLSNKAHVLISGKRAPVIGRVCMNMIMVDITHIADAKVGSVATLIGTDEKESVTADDLADWMGTINYEVTTKIEPGIPRILVD